MIPEFLDPNVMVYQRDAVDFVNLLASESVQLIFTAPPGCAIPLEKTFSHMEAVELCAAMADAATRALAPTGVLIISLADQNTSGVVAAIVKRTHLQCAGYTYDPTDVGNTLVVFHKGSPTNHGETVAVEVTTHLASIVGFVEAYSDPGDIVVDPFCGTGVVMEAAVTSGRIAIVNDQDPAAVEATVNRYKELSAQ